MKALYRRYRPKTLVEVVGQEQVTEPLIKSLQAGKVGHAYLFVGPRGCGKTSVARILAHEVNGFKYELEDDYVDIIEIDGASNRGIDNIRELREKVAIAPTTGKYKVYIIDEVHMLTKEAFNALLKTLEEPPAHAIFIMATTDAYKVPVTITSRAQTYTFKLADEGVMLKHLKLIAKKEKIKISDEALEVIARRGGGSFRDSLSLLDQISTLSNKEITKDLVVKAMGLPEDEKIAELLAEYKLGDVAKITAILKDLLASGVKAETITEEIIRQIIDEPRPELLPLLARLPEVKAPYAEAKLIVCLAQGLSEHLFSGPASRPSTSYAGTPAEPPLRGEPVGSVRNIRLGPSNRKLSREKDVSATRAEQGTQSNGAGSVESSEKAISSQPQPQPQQPSSVFSWEEFLEKVRQKESGIYMKLARVGHELSGTELHIYPNTKPTYNYLAKDHVKATLAGASDGVKITIHEVGEAPSGGQKDETLDKISAIMGGEVVNDGGGNPF